MKRTKINLIIILVLSIYLILVQFFDIRICLIYNLFHIPCPACGLTRAFGAFLDGDMILSLKYNILLIPIILFFILYFIFSFIDDINNTNKLENFFKRYKFIIIPLVVILVLIAWGLNLYNNK